MNDEERRQLDAMREPLYRQTRELLEALSPKRWLDFGCGAGSLLVRNQDLGEGVGYDNDPTALKVAAERGLTVFSEWEDVPEVDLIVALDVIEHMGPADLQEWLGRWHSKLAPGGRLLLASVNPECLTVWCEFWHDATHVRPYTPACLAGLARAAGFEQERLVLKRLLPRRRLSLRPLARLLRAVDILPPMGSEFDRYWITYNRL